MAEPYNLSLATGGNNLLGIIQASNTYTDSSFGVLILIAIWVIIFLRLKNYETKAAMFTASFLCSIVSLLFVFMSFVSFNVFLLCVLITAVVMVLGKTDE